MGRLTAKNVLRVALPLLVIAFFSVVITILYVNSPEPKSRSKRVAKAKVFTIKSKEEDRLLRVKSQGEVTPTSIVDIRPEISGKIQYISKKMVAGGEFKRGEILISIDPEAYELEVIQHQERVADTEQKYMTAKAESDAAIVELEQMGRVDASDLAKGLPQLRRAQAALNSAKAQLRLAQLDLSYTHIRAPFDGRVQDEVASLGQYVIKNTALATVYSIDVAEIRLPLTLEQLTQIGLPLAYFEQGHESPFDVMLSMDLGGRVATWAGKIIRTEAVVDRRTRTIYAVARVNDPYAPGKTPLLSGAFVAAEIIGVNRVKVTSLPPKVLRNGQALWLVDKDKKLNIVTANIVQRSRDALLVSNLANGSQVISSSLPIPTQGMPVNVVNVKNDKRRKREEDAKK